MTWLKRLFGKQPVRLTPHQKGVITKRRQRSAWVQQHCATIRASEGFGGH